MTASTGNHGAATAWAAQRTGLRAIVYVPEIASRAKLDLLESLGAELRQAGADVDEAKDAARAHAERDGLPFFEDGAEPAQFEGYSAIGRELVDQLGERPALTVVPVGNGALLIGVARGLGGEGALGVVSKGAPVMALSVEAGRPVECGAAGHVRGRSRRAGGGPARGGGAGGAGHALRLRSPSARSRGRWAPSRRPASGWRARGRGAGRARRQSSRRTAPSS